MNERGFTLLETILAGVLVALVLLAVGTFYVSTARVEENNDAKTYLQRQASIIFAEMTKQIGEATASTMVIPCPGRVADSLRVTNSRGNYCFRRDDAGTGFLMDTPAGGTWDLLSGAPARLGIISGTCPSAGGFCPGLVTKPPPSTEPVAAVITLRLRYQFAESTGYETMTFNTTIAGRN